MYACYCVFNGERTLAKSLKSILPFVDKVVMVDGAFQLYPHKVPWSTDNTKGIAEELCGNKLIWVGCEKAWSGEVEKRSTYFKHVPDGEMLIIIDHDEVLEESKPNAFQRQLNRIGNKYPCVGIQVVSYVPKWSGSFLEIPECDWPKIKWYENPDFSARSAIYRKVKGMEYRQRHSAIYAGDKLVSLALNELIEQKLVLKDVILKNNVPPFKTWKQYMSDIIYRYNRVTSKIERKGRRRWKRLTWFTGGKVPTEEEVQSILKAVMRMNNELTERST